MRNTPVNTMRRKLHFRVFGIWPFPVEKPCKSGGFAIGGKAGQRPGCSQNDEKKAQSFFDAMVKNTPPRACQAKKDFFRLLKNSLWMERLPRLCLSWCGDETQADRNCSLGLCPAMYGE